MERMTVAVGDVHGCIEELNELLKTIQYNKNQMRLVFLGDLMDRGPDPVACVRRVRELDVECIMGNHEEKHLRWRKHEKNRERTGKANPMKRMSDVDALANEALSDQDFTWLKALPLKLDLGNNLWAVHAGCEPRYTLDRQSPSQIMRVRYVNQEGVAQALGPNLSQPEGTVYWDQLWKGPESIIYGHCVHSLDTVRSTNLVQDVFCTGIDTGCCFGGQLTAALIDPTDSRHITFAYAKAKKKYYAGYGED
jgi:bis(5'-nucleosyl)-tetraphosphatase (symmetrical)